MVLPKGGVKLFRVFDVSVELDYSWFIFFFLVVWTFANFYFPARYQGAHAVTVVWVLSAATAILLFFSVIFHELSHAVVSNRLGFPIKRITLFVFGGVAHMTSEPDSPRTELAVAGAGPLSSLFLWIVFATAAGVAVASHMGPVAMVLSIVAQLNVALALFNLVPGFPLDGGRLLRATMWWVTKSFRRATNWAAKGGELFAYFLMLLGVVSIYREHSMAGWISGIWYILIGVFVKNAAEQSYQHVLIEEVLSGIHVAEIMGQNALAVSSTDSLDELIAKKFLQHKFTLYPVTDDGGQVVGVVDLEDIRRVPREERDDRHVSDVMQPIPPTRLPTPGTRATEALKAMLALGVGLLPVIDDEGQLAGIVSRADIMSMFRIRADLGEELVV